MIALILFFFKVKVNTIDELAEYWSYIELLENNEVLPMATNPLDLNVKKR